MYTKNKHAIFIVSGRVCSAVIGLFSSFSFNHEPFRRSVYCRSISTLSGHARQLCPFAARFPRFTIIAVTDGYFETAGRSKEELIGKGLFEAFPNSPDDLEGTSEKLLGASLTSVLFQK